MKCNIGKTDRIIRLIVGAGIMGAGLYFQSWFGIIGAVVFTTALVRFCPFYVPLGISSCDKDSKAV